MNNAIEIHDLCKTYPGFSLRNVSFTVPEGLCCGFVGPNGAGKSTTLRIMAGLAFPDSGDIRLLGRHAGDPAVKEEIQKLFHQNGVPKGENLGVLRAGGAYLSDIYRRDGI